MLSSSSTVQFFPTLWRQPLPADAQHWLPLLVTSLTVGAFEMVFFRGFAQRRLEAAFGRQVGIGAAATLCALYDVGYAMGASGWAIATNPRLLAPARSQRPGSRWKCRDAEQATHSSDQLRRRCPRRGCRHRGGRRRRARGGTPAAQTPVNERPRRRCLPPVEGNTT
jgi:hypothetical protein